MLLQTLNNHPVHILNNKGELSPSSFIPFCFFGENLIGSKVNQLDILACDIFKPKIHQDQFCYETDLQELKSSNDQILKEQLESGLTLVLDYNMERQINYNGVEKSLYRRTSSVSIYLNTISM